MHVIMCKLMLYACNEKKISRKYAIMKKKSHVNIALASHRLISYFSYKTLLFSLTVIVVAPSASRGCVEIVSCIAVRAHLQRQGKRQRHKHRQGLSHTDRDRDTDRGRYTNAVMWLSHTWALGVQILWFRQDQEHRNGKDKNAECD